MLVGADELLDDLHRPREALRPGGEGPDRLDGFLAGAEDPAERRILLFLIGDRRIHVEREPPEEDLSGVRGADLGESLDGLLPVVVLDALFDAVRPLRSRTALRSRFAIRARALRAPLEPIEQAHTFFLKP